MTTMRDTHRYGLPSYAARNLSPLLNTVQPNGVVPLITVAFEVNSVPLLTDDADDHRGVHRPMPLDANTIADLVHVRLRTLETLGANFRRRFGTLSAAVVETLDAVTWNGFVPDRIVTFVVDLDLRRAIRFENDGGIRVLLPLDENFVAHFVTTFAPSRREHRRECQNRNEER